MPKASMIRVTVILIIAAMVIFTGSYDNAQGQAERKVACGDVIESEFSKDYESHFYLLKMNPRNSFSVSVDAVGDLLQSAIALYGPTGILLGISNNGAVSPSSTITSGILSARGDYKIQVANADFFADGGLRAGKGGVGIYTLYIECELTGSMVTAISSTPAPSIQSAETEKETSTLITQSLPPFLEMNKTYEITFASSTYTVMITGLRSDGWVQVEYDNKTAWLNLNQVILITPVED